VVLIGEINPFRWKQQHQPWSEVKYKEEKYVGSDKKKGIDVAGRPVIRHAP
jgi:hypothetical protein